MHTTRRVLRRFARLMNLHDDFNILLVKHRMLRSDSRSFIPNENDAAVPSSRNIAGQGLARNFMLSQTFVRDFSTLTGKEPPEPRSLPVFGTMLDLILAGGAKKLHEYVDKRHRELGPVYREQIGPVRAVFVNSAAEYRKILLDLAGPMPRNFLPESWQLYNEIRGQNRGLLFMDGEEWLHHRRILNNVMIKPDPMEFLCTPCQESAKNLTEKWKAYSQIGCTIPKLEHHLYQWSIEVMLAVMIGSRWRDCKPQLRSEIDYVAMMVHQIFEYSATLTIIPPKLAMKFKLPIWTKFVKIVDTVLERVHNLVPKMIQLSNGDGLLQMITNYGICDDMAGRIITDFIIAAGDTTSVAMQWMLLLLSGRPELQDQLFHDIKNLSAKEILEHKLLRNVRKETLRLYPVAPFLVRYLPTDAIIGGYLVPKGELIVMSLYSSSRDEKNFPRPNEFWPERWMKTKESLPHYQEVNDARASLPFATGLRNCVGRKLAITQMSLTLAELIKNFKIECENRDSIEMILHLVSVPSKPIKLKLTDREI